jgi:hypothetical protein
MRKAGVGPVLSCILLSGCAALFGSSQKDFDFHTNPQGADVFLDGNRLGTTPLQVNLSNHKQYTFVFKKTGYKETSCTLSKGTGGGWVVLDVLGGLAPLVVDAATNSWSQTKGHSCLAQLEPESYSAVAPEAGSTSAAPVVSRPVATETTPASTSVPPAPVAAPAPSIPPGVHFVGDHRRFLYFPATCAVVRDVPTEERYYYRTEAAAQAEGYVLSEKGC